MNMDVAIVPHDGNGVAMSSTTPSKDRIPRIVSPEEMVTELEEFLKRRRTNGDDQGSQSN